MKTQRTAPAETAKPVEPVAVSERSALNRCATFPFAQTGLKALAMLAVAGFLAACGSVSVSHGAGDAAGSSQGASGITVFGDIDMGVTRQRSR